MADQAREILGTWQFSANEMDLLGLRTGDVLGPGVVGFATDDDDPDL
jgi:hypothetical protein